MKTSLHVVTQLLLRAGAARLGHALHSTRSSEMIMKQEGKRLFAKYLQKLT